MVIDASDVRRRYGDTVALDGVSLEVAAGEVFAVIGPNGAGKTTLIRSLTGTTAAEGAISVFGRPPHAVDRERIGVLPQEFTPASRLTARELITYYAGLYDEARPVEDVIADVGLSGHAETWYDSLSGGEKRRTCVGTTLVNDPDLLVLDEPTTGIDPTGRRAVWQLIDELAERGTTIVLTTHYMDEAEALADRVGLLADGEFVALGSPTALIEQYAPDPSLTIETVAVSAARAALTAAGYTPEPSRVGLSVAVDPADIPAIADALDTAGVAYDGLVWRQPTLDDVFAALTDQATASADVAPAGRRV